MTDRGRSDPARIAFAGLVLVLTGTLFGCNPAPSPAQTTTGSPGAPTIAPSGSFEPLGSASPVPTSVETSTAGTPPCEPTDLNASHGLVDGAAGSRLTTVVLLPAVTCTIDAFPAVGLRDAQGTILVGSASAGPGRLELGEGIAYESNVRLANWCASQPAFPLELEIVLAGKAVPVTGTSFPDEGDLPPCNGDGGPILEASQWMAAP